MYKLCACTIRNSIVFLKHGGERKAPKEVPLYMDFNLIYKKMCFILRVLYKCDTVRNEGPFYKIRNSDTCQIAMLLTPSPWSVGKEKVTSHNLCLLQSMFAEELGVRNLKNVINEKMG
ncbi:hypothetical protein POVWA2_003650 [Plasmodium ovale wallikeri]|uniref:Uncharacterized protein n=1 Tax=Plasmodium ovale wallikeri TaxID=864142 RepID=A0A1A8YIH9_PLAOA|nr:hypothetical protein POVWA1_003500 [Plasmodium ovale wallikeri]SBT31339.1 hypothetical protein POVWA2_003650 [Plasmodium ovale wallikeri]